MHQSKYKNLIYYFSKMKAAIILFMLSISFLPLAISGFPSLIRLPTKAAYSAVLDIEGNPVVVGAKYYAIPARIGVVGGVSVDNQNQGNPSTCPTAVVINTSIAGVHPSAEGRPIVFYPLKLNTSGGDAAAIQESVPLNVAFYTSDPSDPCAKETVWKLDAAADHHPVIVTGGVIGNEDDITNWFRIAENVYGEGYVFTFWPTLCIPCKIRYWGIGTVGDRYQLGINDDSRYPFNFVRAE